MNGSLQCCFDRYHLRLPHWPHLLSPLQQCCSWLWLRFSKSLLVVSVVPLLATLRRSKMVRGPGISREAYSVTTMTKPRVLLQDHCIEVVFWSTLCLCPLGCLCTRPSAKMGRSGRKFLVDECPTVAPLPISEGRPGEGTQKHKRLVSAETVKGAA